MLVTKKLANTDMVMCEHKILVYYRYGRVWLGCAVAKSFITDHPRTKLLLAQGQSLSQFPSHPRSAGLVRKGAGDDTFRQGHMQTPVA